MQLFVVSECFIVFSVDSDRANTNRFFVWIAVKAPEYSFDTGQQFSYGKGFGDVVNCAAFERFDDRVFTFVFGENDDGDVIERGKKVEAGIIGKVRIKQNKMCVGG